MSRILSSTLRPSSCILALRTSAFTCMQSSPLLNLDTGLEHWAHSDPSLKSWSLCAGLSTLAFRAIRSARARRRRTKRRDGTGRRITRFMEKEGQLPQNTQRSAARRNRAERDDLEILPRARRAAKEKGRSIVRGHNTTTKMPTAIAKGTVLYQMSRCRKCIDVHLSQVVSIHLKRLC